MATLCWWLIHSKFIGWSTFLHARQNLSKIDRQNHLGRYFTNAPQCSVDCFQGLGTLCIHPTQSRSIVSAMLQVGASHVAKSGGSFICGVSSFSISQIFLRMIRQEQFFLVASLLPRGMFWQMFLLSCEAMESLWITFGDVCLYVCLCQSYSEDVHFG